MQDENYAKKNEKKIWHNARWVKNYRVYAYTEWTKKKNYI